MIEVVVHKYVSLKEAEEDRNSMISRSRLFLHVPNKKAAKEMK